MKIENNAVVTLQYKLTNDTGEVLDTSEGEEPLVYLHGSDSIIPGLESALTGKGAGDQIEVTVQPEDGYGEFNEAMIQVIPREAFEGIDEIQPGMQFQAESPEGQLQIVCVKEIGDEDITIDANHPLAGQVLNFDITIDEVREATKEELDHGHVH
ncbi:MAG: peptidylprolyl isomerase [Deltaproteobacteria bacterium]|nr:peptidylprolyl isomerase [Deltaproteobacteria bacterium]